jgi:hypothetical protein
MTKKMHMFGNSETNIFPGGEPCTANPKFGFSKGAPFEKALALIYREALSNEVNKWQPGLN